MVVDVAMATVVIGAIVVIAVIGAIVARATAMEAEPHMVEVTVRKTALLTLPLRLLAPQILTLKPTTPLSMLNGPPIMPPTLPRILTPPMAVSPQSWLSILRVATISTTVSKATQPVRHSLPHLALVPQHLRHHRPQSPQVMEHHLPRPHQLDRQARATVLYLPRRACKCPEFQSISQIDVYR